VFWLARVNSLLAPRQWEGEKKGGPPVRYGGISLVKTRTIQNPLKDQKGKRRKVEKGQRVLGGGVDVKI